MGNLKILILVFTIHALARANELDLGPDCDPTTDSNGCENRKEKTLSPPLQNPVFGQNFPEVDAKITRRLRSSPTRRMGDPHLRRGNPTASERRRESALDIDNSAPRIPTPEVEVAPTGGNGVQRPTRRPRRRQKGRKRKDKKRKSAKNNVVVAKSDFHPTNASFEAEDTVSTSEPYCPDCGLLPCPKTDLNNCKGGLTYGYCNCCKQCAKVEGEECGGVHDHFGKCDGGLKCTVPLRPSVDVRVVTTRDTPEDRMGSCTRGELF